MYYDTLIIEITRRRSVSTASSKKWDRGRIFIYYFAKLRSLKNTSLQDKKKNMWRAKVSETTGVT